MMLEDRTAVGFSLSWKTVSGAICELYDAARTLKMAFPPPPEDTSREPIIGKLIQKFRGFSSFESGAGWRVLDVEVFFKDFLPPHVIIPLSSFCRP